MTAVAPVFVDVTTLAVASRIAYAGKTYTVLRVVPVAELGGHVVIGIEMVSGKQLACYFNEQSPAGLIGVS